MVKNTRGRDQSALRDFLSFPDVGFVVIDMQEDFIPKLPECMALIERQVDLLSDYRDVPLIALNYSGSGSLAEPLLGEVEERDQGVIATKSTDNGFYSGNLTDVLSEFDLERLVFMGCNTSWCVWETARTAVDNGFQIATSREFISEPEEYGQRGDGRTEGSLRWYRNNCDIFY